MPTGKVRWFNAEKGFGFIDPYDGSERFFVRSDEIQATGFKVLEEDQQVDYEIHHGAKGREAQGVEMYLSLMRLESHCRWSLHLPANIPPKGHHCSC